MLSLVELQIRAALFSTIRSFFSKHHFLEVDTPVRQPVIIPESCIQALPSGDHFLQTSPELCMKRLLASGCRKIFQICPCFRREERGRLHLEEFTMLEWYRCDADYFDLMADCEKFLRYLIKGIHHQFPELDAITSDALLVGGGCNLSPPWQRLTVADAFVKWSPTPMAKALALDSFDEILVEYIEPHLGQDTPTFLFNYPAVQASLARKSKVDQSVAERFELYINGVELANGFSELTDPVKQRSRFETELALIEKSSAKKMGMPERFLEELGKLGETAGIALGVDRLLMVILGKKEIGDVVTFSPQDL
jgi:lysyl-tRNA synthetase class 2